MQDTPFLCIGRLLFLRKQLRKGKRQTQNYLHVKSWHLGQVNYIFNAHYAGLVEPGFMWPMGTFQLTTSDKSCLHIRPAFSGEPEVVQRLANGEKMFLRNNGRNTILGIWKVPQVNPNFHNPNFSVQVQVGSLSAQAR
jgi:hypothetical protein